MTAAAAGADPQVQELLRRAREHVRAAQPAHAEALAEVALAWDPGSGEAMEILGRIALGRGEHARAAGLLAASAARQETAARLADLARALVALKRLDEGAAAFGRAAALAPDDGSLANDLGVALAQTGQLVQAEAAFRRATALRPDMAEPRNNLATVLRELGRPEEAAALAPAPTPADDAAAERERAADTLLRAQRADEAVAASSEAVACRPDDPNLRRRHADRLQIAGRLAEAEAELRHVLAAWPESPAAYSALGWVVRRQGRLAEAIAMLSAASAQWPDNALVLNSLAVALLDAGQPEHALALLDRAVALAQDDGDIQHNRSTVLLRLGRFQEGWEAYEWRWRMPQGKAVHRAFSQPLWSGEALDGRTILLHSEQGLGDSLQFLRYVRLVAARGARVVLEVPAPLARLAAGLSGVATLVVAGDALPAFDLHCPMMSLPRAFATTIQTIPPAPYLAADPAHAAAWRDRLGGAAGLRVGVVWAGSAEHRDDARRSVPLAALAPLWQVPGVRWFSLQVGPRASDLSAAPAGLLTDLGSLLGDFADTAAALAALDLLVTVDTATLHLAGALGRPAWLMLAHATDWRWMRDPVATPWYPSVRLFRQPEAGAWNAVAEHVAQALAALAQRATVAG